MSSSSRPPPHPSGVSMRPGGRSSGARPTRSSNTSFRPGSGSSTDTAPVHRSGAAPSPRHDSSSSAGSRQSTGSGSGQRPVNSSPRHGGSAPRHPSTGSRHNGASGHDSGSPRHTRAPPRHDPSSRYSGNHRNEPGSPSHSTENRPRHGSNQRDSDYSTASPNDIGLNVSRLSHASGHSVQSAVMLGGVEYPVGSRIGTTGMFVIGDPDVPRHDTSGSYKSSMPSITSSSAPMYRGQDKGYSFEDWNWSVIRFVCFIIICIIMVGLLAGVIAVAIKHKENCDVKFLWWKGSTFYNLPVPYFHDSDNSNIGDIVGVEKRTIYFEYMNIGAVVLKNYLSAKKNNWDLVTSFTEVDPRLGTTESFQQMVKELHDSNVKVVLHMCPWYTSTEHVWYKESQDSSMFSNSQYSSFYVWRRQPDNSIEGSWQFDIIRNQYYLYRGDPERPLLDWTNSKVHDTFKGILELWLQRGVDGFVICDIDKFYVTSEATIYSVLSRFHLLLNGYSQDDDSQKILVIDGSYVKRMEKNYITLVESLYQTVDLLQAPLTMLPENRTIGLPQQVNASLKMQEEPGNPWVLWDLTSLLTVPEENLGSLQLFDLMLPGSPSYTAGQEVGWFYLENEERYQAPLVWLSEAVKPQNAGGLLGLPHLEALRNISRERTKAYSLRMDRPFDIDQKTAEVNLIFDEIDPLWNTLLMSRHFPSDNTYYFAANFGDNPRKMNLAERIAPWATVVADSSNKFYGRLELREVTLDPGQSIVFYPTK